MISISEIIEKTICFFMLHKLLTRFNVDCLKCQLKLLQQLSTNDAVSNKNKITLPNNWLNETTNIFNEYNISTLFDDISPLNVLTAISNKLAV